MKSTPPPILDEVRCKEASLFLYIAQDVFVAKITSDGQRLFHQKFYLDDTTSDFASKLADSLYTLPFLTFQFKDVYIAFLASQYVTIPPELSDEDNEYKWLATLGNKQQKGDYIGTYSLDESASPHIVVTWQNDAYNFLKRTYINAVIRPLQGCIWQNIYRKSLCEERRHFALLIDSTSIDFAIFHKGMLLYGNRYDRVPYTQTENNGKLSDQLLFWWVAICNSLGIESVNGDVIDLYALSFDDNPKAIEEQIDLFIKEVLSCGLHVNIRDTSEIDIWQL